MNYLRNKNQFFIGVFFFAIILLELAIVKPICAQDVLSNKPFLDTSAVIGWPSLGSCWISSGGRYVGYLIDKPGLGSVVLTISDSSGKWRKEYNNAFACYF